MKFTDGNWMMQPGVKAHYATELYEVEVDECSLAMTVPCDRMRNNRGATLSGPLLGIQASSPMPDVIRIAISHFDNNPNGILRFKTGHADKCEVSASVSGDHAVLTSGDLEVRIPKEGPWRLDFTGHGKALTSSEPRGIGYIHADGASYMHEQLTLGVGENVYGFGERFTAFVKNGQVVESWNKDGGTGSDQAYKSIPFYITNKGYGVFVNHPGALSFEVASEKVSRVQFSVPGESLEYYVIYGPTPKEILRKYTALTGKPALPTAWSFGLWLSTSFTTSYDEDTVTKVVNEMASRDLPLHVFHFDCFWMRELRFCDFEWDSRVFPDPPAMLARLKELGLKICVWINPYIAQLSPLFREGADKGYLLKRADGTVWQSDQWQPGMGIVDFTNPDATRWYQGKLAALLDMGVDCFKTDFGERIPVDVEFFDGANQERMHNYYTLLYNKAVFDVLEEKRGVGDAVLFARSATTGGQMYPVHWGGDCNSNFESMAESLRGGLSLGLAGFGFWSHDIGGFEGTPDPAVYKRWVAFGLLSSHSRLHGSGSYRVPWAFDEEAVDVLRHFTKLKCRLMPYLYSKAVEASAEGVPMMRAMMLEFPSDPTCDTLDRQYMLGESLLVAPVFSAAGHVQYYVPAGTWTEFETDLQVAGPAWVNEEHGFMSAPLLVRPGSIVAVGNRDDKPDYDYSAGVTFHVYGLENGSTLSATVPDVSGTRALSVTVHRNGNRITAHAYGNTSSWAINIHGIASVKAITGVVDRDAVLGIRVAAGEGRDLVEIEFSE